MDREFVTGKTCANQNCPKLANNPAWYHTTSDLWFCYNCAMAVASAGGNAEKEDFETEPIGFGRAMKWLLYKNFKQQCVRRPIALTCKMVCPVISLVILGLIKMAVPIDDPYTSYADDLYTVDFEYTNYDYYTFSGHPDRWLRDAICNWEYALIDGEWDDYEVGRYLAIVGFGDDTNGHIQGVLDIMNQSFPDISDEEAYCVVHPNDEDCEDLIAMAEANGTYVPSNNATCYGWVSYLPFREGWTLRFFDTESDFNSFIGDSGYGIDAYSPEPDGTVETTKPIGTALVFEVSDDGTQWSYKIRGNSSAMLYPPGTRTDSNNKNKYYDIWTKASVESMYYELGHSQYVDNGFLQLQTFVEQSIAEYIASLKNQSMNSTHWPDTPMNFMPVEVPEKDPFWGYVSFTFLFLCAVQFVYPFSQVVSQLIHEKHDKIKEGMKMMGVTTAAYWCSWFAWLFAEATIIALLCWVCGLLFKIYHWSSPLVIFIWLWSFCINFVSFAAMFAQFFDNPQIAVLAAFIFFFVLVLMPLFFGNWSQAERNAMCLVGPTCFGQSVETLAFFEQQTVGVQWDTMGETYNNFAFGTAIGMMILDTFIYILLTLYFEKVWPSRYGQRMHPLFFLSPGYWSPNRNRNAAVSNLESGLLHKQLSKFEEIDPDDQNYADSKRVIQVRGLKKHFASLFDLTKSGEVVKAVDGVSLDMYEGEVFCLLGHNGAGKTTTIGMLTGLLNITEGNAWVNGMSVMDDMAQIRQNLGVCPQHDVLFRRLNTEEHLYLFARIKGVPEQFIKNEVERTMMNVGITDKRHSFPHQMSGGQKRKLSLGIALIGGSKVVFLDEPTSGMDPESRKATQNMIAREKESRCIILTTHFMDEADKLGDRIAVMADGQVKCCGSSLFLKRQYGVGYTFVVSLEIDVQNVADTKRRINSIVIDGVAGAEVVASAGAEITYRLPFEETESFPAVFEKLDQFKEALSINTYGISVTTLEEVFLKIGHQAEVEYNAEHQRKSIEKTTPDEEKYVDLAGDDPTKNPFPQPSFQLEEMSSISIFFRHVWAIMYQRVILSYRDLRSVCCQMMCPLLFTLLGMWLLTLITNQPTQPALLMTVDQWYDPSEYNMLVSISDEFNDEDYDPTNEVASYRNNYRYVWNTTGLDSYGGNWMDFEFEDSEDADESQMNFADELLANRNPSDGILHFNAFYIPSYLPDDDDRRRMQDYSSVNDWSESNDRVYLTVNLSAYHGLPITYNAWNNLNLRQFLRDEMESDSSFEPSIELISHPLPRSTTEKAFDGQFAGYLVSMFLTIGLGFLPLGAIYQIVNDRANLTKHQQLVSGVSCAAYWTGNYIADFVITLPTVLLMWALVHAFDADTFIDHNAQGPFVVTIILYSLAILPFTYLLSFLFKSADKAQVVAATLYFMMGLVLVTASWIVRIAVPERKLSDKGKDLLEDIVYRIFPTFSMGDCFIDLSFRAFTPEVDEWEYSSVFYYVLSYDMGKNLTCLAVEALLYFSMVIALEYALLYRTVISKWWFRNDDRVLSAVDSINYDECDSDVAAEVERVRNLNITKHSDGDGDKVVIKGLHKLYQPDMVSCKGDKRTVHAVRGVHLGVARGEVFGYLGVNGAGKTTTLACLTGERSMTHGEAYINGISVDNQTATRRFVGYCPQFDALFPLLTGREHLNFYGRIKGLYGTELENQVNMLLKVLSLTKYQDRRAGTYSGGNRRKLSVAVAMIGNPPIVFLDEPSTGMDPMARRSMWDFIRQTMRGRCVILTTHSMEECEALCHKLCIMTHGQLRCLGTPQHLKSKFGHGYQLDMEVEKEAVSGPSPRERVEEALRAVFDINMIDQAQTKLTYEVALKEQGSMTLGQVFGAMERFKRDLPIVSYALNQTTLEQVFIRMAGENHEDDAV